MPVDRPLIRQEMQLSGQWDEFQALRDRYKSQGSSLDDAWGRAHADLSGGPGGPGSDPVIDILDPGDDSEAGGGFPPPVPAAAQSSPSSSPGVGDLLGETRDMSSVVPWVFDNIDNATVKRSQAPTPGAWSWLAAVRNDPDTRRDFYARHVTKMIRPVSETEDAYQFDDDGRRCLETIEEIKRMVEEAERLTI